MATPPRPRKRIFNELVGRKLIQEDLPGIVRACTFSGRIMLQRPIPGTWEFDDPDSFKPRPWTDIDTTGLTMHFNTLGYAKTPSTIVDRVVAFMAGQDRYSAVVDYFDAIPIWDGVPRLDGFLMKACGAEPRTPGQATYLQKVSRKFFISICARVYDPGCKVDTMLTLQGSQGINKSRLLRVLALKDEWFSDTLPHDLASKDAQQALPGKLIVEMSDFAQKGKTSPEAIKRYLSTQQDNYRPSYGRHSVTWPRQCVFAASTNKDLPLDDDTGNRRFWPVTCGEIDINYAIENVRQLYAEALVAYRAKERWWFNVGEDGGIVEAEQDARVELDPWDEIIVRALHGILNNHPANITEFETSVSDMLKLIEMPKQQMDRSHQMRVSAILKRKGFQRVMRTQNGNARVWKYVLFDMKLVKGW